MIRLKQSTVGVVYLLTDIQLAPRLIVSLHSLRRWYSGPITLFTTQKQSHEIGELCRKDPALRIRHERISEVGGIRHQSAYRTKANLANHFPYDYNVFLDADTLVVKPIDQLLDDSSDVSLTVTNFVGLTTNKNPFKANFSSWRKIQDTPGDSFSIRQRMDIMLNNPITAINTGVYAARRCKKFAKRWNEIVQFGREMVIPDEVGMQLLLFEFSHNFLGQEYNFHPSGAKKGIKPRIWHFAGACHLQTSLARKTWLPAYRECEQKNIANITQWSRIECDENQEDDFTVPKLRAVKQS